MTGEGIRQLLTTFAGNIFMAVAAIVAIVFLFKREFVSFAQFAIIAVLVATFVYTPEVWRNVAESVANAIGS